MLHAREGDAHEYLYWLNNQPDDAVRRHLLAVRWKNWKGIRLGFDSAVELYDLRSDISESQNVADRHPDIRPEKGPGIGERLIEQVGKLQ